MEFQPFDSLLLKPNFFNKGKNNLQPDGLDLHRHTVHTPSGCEACAIGDSTVFWKSGMDQELLKSVSRSFYLSLRFLPEAVRAPLGLAYMLARASDTLADASTAPLAARLDALDAFRGTLEFTASSSQWRTLAEQCSNLPCEHAGEARLLAKIEPLLRAYHGLDAALRSELHTVLDTIIAGQRGDLVRFGYASENAPQALLTAEDTVAYTYAVAGCVGEFWTRVCALRLRDFAAQPVAELVELGRHFGQGLQLVNILRDLPADLRAGRCYLPAEELSAAGLSVEDLLRHPERGWGVFERWLAQAEAWLDAGTVYVKGIRGARLRFSVALPRRLGEKTLALLKHRST